MKKCRSTSATTMFRNCIKTQNSSFNYFIHTLFTRMSNKIVLTLSTVITFFVLLHVIEMRNVNATSYGLDTTTFFALQINNFVENDKRQCIIGRVGTK